jgi:hypothetical protein
VLARIAEGRSESGRFAPVDIEQLFHEMGLPAPARMSNVLATLERSGLIARIRGRGGVWRLTPRGRADASHSFSDIDVTMLLVEAASTGSAILGRTTHPVIPPSLAPPELLAGLSRFLDQFPFERNVFGMTRFPDEEDEDPVRDALTAARDVCAMHGLAFHLASDRAIADDLWANVAGHMWASLAGIAFLEDRAARGLNYNLTIEVGSMLMAGRRCALLKDVSIVRLPTDLVGKIYKGVNFDNPGSVAEAIHTWIADDLGLGRCDNC